MDDETRLAIERRCFHGRPLPTSLRTLWDEGGEALAQLFGITRLLVDMDAVDAGYGEPPPDAEGDHSWARAYRVVFEQLAFFAELDGGELLAYWLGSTESEPPVVVLDTEGLLSFKGIDLREALARLAEDQDTVEEASAWQEAAGLAPGELPELGVTTQFLPDLEKLHASIAAKLAGRPDREPTPRARALDPREVSTWILQSGAAVEPVIAGLLDEPLQSTFVWTSGTGLVHSLALEQGLAEKVTVLGLSNPATRASVEAALGKPDMAGDGYIAYVRDDVRHNFRFDVTGDIEEINLACAGAAP